MASEANLEKLQRLKRQYNELKKTDSQDEDLHVDIRHPGMRTYAHLNGVISAEHAKAVANKMNQPSVGAADSKSKTKPVDVDFPSKNRKTDTVDYHHVVKIPQHMHDQFSQAADVMNIAQKIAPPNSTNKDLYMMRMDSPGKTKENENFNAVIATRDTDPADSSRSRVRAVPVNFEGAEKEPFRTREMNGQLLTCLSTMTSQGSKKKDWTGSEGEKGPVEDVYARHPTMDAMKSALSKGGTTTTPDMTFEVKSYVATGTYKHHLTNTGKHAFTPLVFQGKQGGGGGGGDVFSNLLGTIGNIVGTVTPLIGAFL